MVNLPSDRYLALKAAMMPRDTNKYGTIFGGVLLSHIDLAGDIGAHAVFHAEGWSARSLVTVAMDRVEFKEPVFVGDTLSLWTQVSKIGRTSICVHVVAEVERKNQRITVTEADVTYVAIESKDGKRVPVAIRE